MKPYSKKLIATIILAGMLSSISLTGCAKIDEVSQKMMDDINAIGTVEISDKDAIEKAENLYGTLTDKQKEQVNNYADLLNARDELDKLLEEKAKKDAEEAEKAKQEYEQKFNKIVDIITQGAVNYPLSKANGIAVGLYFKILVNIIPNNINKEITCMSYVKRPFPIFLLVHIEACLVLYI